MPRRKTATMSQRNQLRSQYMASIDEVVVANAAVLQDIRQRSVLVRLEKLHVSGKRVTAHNKTVTVSGKLVNGWKHSVYKQKRRSKSKIVSDSNNGQSPRKCLKEKKGRQGKRSQSNRKLDNSERNLDMLFGLKENHNNNQQVNGYKNESSQSATKLEIKRKDTNHSNSVQGPTLRPNIFDGLTLKFENATKKSGSLTHASAHHPVVFPHECGDMCASHADGDDKQIRFTPPSDTHNTVDIQGDTSNEAMKVPVNIIPLQSNGLVGKAVGLLNDKGIREIDTHKPNQESSGLIDSCPPKSQPPLVQMTTCDLFSDNGRESRERGSDVPISNDMCSAASQHILEKDKIHSKIICDDVSKTKIIAKNQQPIEMSQLALATEQMQLPGVATEDSTDLLRSCPVLSAETWTDSELAGGDMPVLEKPENIDMCFTPVTKVCDVAIGNIPVLDQDNISKNEISSSAQGIPEKSDTHPTTCTAVLQTIDYLTQSKGLKVSQDKVSNNIETAAASRTVDCDSLNPSMKEKELSDTNIVKQIVQKSVSNDESIITAAITKKKKVPTATLR